MTDEKEKPTKFQGTDEDATAMIKLNRELREQKEKQPKEKKPSTSKPHQPK